MWHIVSMQNSEGILTTPGQHGWLDGQSASATLGHAIKPLVMPETHNGHYIWYQSKFLSALQGENVHRGQPRDTQTDTVCERGRKRKREREQGKVEEKEIRGKINVTRTRELY